MRSETLNIISLPRRQDRRDSLIPHLEYMNIKHEFWWGIEAEGEYPFVGVMRAHKQIIAHAKRMSFPYVIIGEDDIRFSDKGAWQYYLESMPESFDLYLGMIYCGQIPDKKTINSPFAGLQLYTVHSRHYEFVLESPEDKHLDMHLGEFSYKHEYFVCDPFVCYGEAGFSDNTKQMWNHSHDLLPNRLYGLEDK